MERKNKALSLIVFSIIALLGLIYFFWAIRIVWPYTVDDAYIVLNYSRNFVEHGSMLWSMSGDHAEGYTSFSYMLLMALGLALHVPILWWDKLIGIFSVLVIVAVLGFRVYCSGLILNAVVLGVLANFLLFNTDTSIHAISGLETAFYTLLVFFYSALFCKVLSLGYDRKETLRYFRNFALFSLLLGLSRPEGNIFVMSFSLILLFSSRAELRWAFVRSMFIYYILPAAAYFVWRCWYYQALLPLPFYIKVHNSVAFPGLQEVSAYLQEYWPVFVAAVLIILSAHSRKKAVLLGFVLAFLIEMFLAIKTYPMMDYNHRYTYPLIALALSSAYFVDYVSGAKKVFLTFLVLGLFGLFAHYNWTYRTIETQSTRAYGESLAAAHIKLGKALAACNSPGSIVEIGDAGAVPYYSHWNAIDGLGLNNRIIATRNLSDKERANYILSQHPRVVVLISRVSSSQPIFWISWEQVLYQEATQQGMRPIKIYTFSPDYFLWVLAYPNDKGLIKCLAASS